MQASHACSSNQSCACAGAGADVLFVEPRSKGADVGITVSPVRIASLEQFGDLAAVGDRLLAAERSKVRAVSSAA